jgi:hypothetical protein
VLWELLSVLEIYGGSQELLQVMAVMKARELFL